MCGIAGLFDTSGSPIERTTLTAMTRSIAHRGPDGEGIWIDGPVGLGHRRLAIRDLSDAGAQPMSDAAGQIVITYNGEIYNEAELRRSLESEFGVRFRSRCDAEIIPYGYLAWGEGVFARLEGMFAIGLWDSRRRRLVLARDGVGIKPLYYSLHDGIVRFGSEVKALLADPAQPRRVDPAMFATFLSLGYTGPSSSLLDGIGQVPPGSYLTFDASPSPPIATRFWQPRRSGSVTRLDDALDGFMALWPGVVDQHLASDVPIGVMQSGGIDSSLVSLALAKTGRVPLLSAVFEDKSFDESEAASELARSIGAEFVPIPVSAPPAQAEERFLEITHHTDGQIADSSCYAVLPLARSFRSVAKVALSGDGGDEFFGGYPTYRATRIASAIRPLLPLGLTAGLAGWIARLARQDESRLPAAEIFARFAAGLSAPGGEPHAEWRRLIGERQLAELAGPALKPHLTPGAGTALYRQAIGGGQGSLIDRCLLADQSYYLPSDMLMKVDSMSMATGLEVRVPFLDRRVMDFAGTLHASLLAPLFGQTKPVLRAAAQRLGAPDVIIAGRKRGFQVPIARLLRTDLRRLGDALLDEAADDLAPLLSPAAVQHHWRDHCSGAANHAYSLWALLTFAAWQRSLRSSAQAAAR